MYFAEQIWYFIEYVLRDPFTQISGFLAMGTILIAYFQKDDYTVKKLMLLSSLFWGTHFYLLWVYSGLAAIVIWVLRLLLSIKYERNFKAFLVIVIITLISGYFTFDWFMSLLPVFTSINGAYSFFFLEKVKLRLAMLLNSSIWLVYHMSIGSISWILNESFTHVILIATVYRMTHPQWWARYYAQKIKDILWKRRKLDYDRFIFIHDRLVKIRKKTWQNFLKVLHLDLKKSILQRKWLLCERYLASKKDKLLSE